MIPTLIVHCVLPLHVDSRVRGWLLMDSYLPTLSLTILYLLTVYLGSKYMRNRPAYSLKGVLQVYNFSVTMLSLYMLVEVSCSKTNLRGQRDV